MSQNAWIIACSRSRLLCSSSTVKVVKWMRKPWMILEKRVLLNGTSISYNRFLCRLTVTSPPWNRLFYGKIRQTFIETLKGVPTKHEKEDLFSHLPVNVGDEVDLVDRTIGPSPYDVAVSSAADGSSKDLGEFSTFDIYDGLGRYFDDTIEYEGQKVPMEVGLVKLPPLLQVQLQVRSG